MSVAERLVQARGKTPRAVVADAVGVSLSAITMYEIGKRIPRDEVKVKLAKFYGVPVQDLFLMKIATISGNRKEERMDNAKENPAPAVEEQERERKVSGEELLTALGFYCEVSQEFKRELRRSEIKDCAKRMLYTFLEVFFLMMTVAASAVMVLSLFEFLLGG